MDSQKDAVNTAATQTASDARGGKNDELVLLDLAFSADLRRLRGIGLCVMLCLIMYMLRDDGTAEGFVDFAKSGIALIAVSSVLSALGIVIITLGVRNPEQAGDFVTKTKDLLEVPARLLSRAPDTGDVSKGHDDERGGERAMSPELKIEKGGDLSCSDK